MTEVGAVGMFFYILIPVGIFGSALRTCLKYPKDPLTPVAFAFANTFIVFWLSDCFSPVTRQIYCAYLFWMTMGIAAGTQRALGEGEEDPDYIADVPVEVVGR
jgi:predicted membrane metal-binding protein